MTEQTLREALNDLTGDITGPDLVDRAWADATRRRRRIQLAMVGTVAASVAAVVIGAAVVGSTPDTAPDPSSPTGTPPSSGSPSASPSAGQVPPDATTSEGDPVWFTRTVEEEAALPWLTQEVLPRSLDLSGGPYGDIGRTSAVAVFVVGDLGGNGAPARAIAIARDGGHFGIDIERLQPVRDQDGNAAALLPAGLSGDGRYVAFTQNSSIEVYEIAASRWQSIDTPDWLAEGARWLDNETLWVPDELGGDVGSTYNLGGALTARDVPWRGAQPSPDGYGPTKSNSAGRQAQSQFSLASMVDGSGSVGFEGLVVQTGERRQVLAYWPPYQGRSKGCCEVVGWFDRDTVAYLSGGRILGWRLGTDFHFRIAEITGFAAGEEWYVASWASLDR